MALDALTKRILNDFSFYEANMRDKDKPHDTSTIYLGDLLATAQSGADAAQTTANTALANAATAQTAANTAQSTANNAQGQLYTAVGANWTDPDPTTLKQAVDRLAAAVAGLLVGTIP